jgi:hypothetical protein
MGNAPRDRRSDQKNVGAEKKDAGQSDDTGDVENPVTGLLIFQAVNRIAQSLEN